MDRIQKLSKFILIVLTTLCILVPLWVTAGDYIWFFLIKKYMSQLSGTLPSPQDTQHMVLITTPSAKVVRIIAELILITPFYGGIIILRRLFKNYTTGEIFSLRNAQFYRSIGWLLVADGLVAGPIGEMLHIFSLSLLNPTGERFLSISFGTGNLGLIFCGMLVIVISWIMAESHKINEERNLTI